MFDTLQELKDTYETARQAIDRTKEPKDELRRLSEFIHHISENSEESFKAMDEPYTKFFYEDFCPGLVKRLNRERSTDDEYLHVISVLLQGFCKLTLELLKTKPAEELVPDFFLNVAKLFEPTSSLHQFNYQIPAEELKALHTDRSPWRNDIKEGDLLDAIMEEKNVNASGWAEARVRTITKDELFLEFTKNPPSNDRVVDRFSIEIAEHNSKTAEQQEWRDTLKPGVLVDGLEHYAWYKSTILEERVTEVAEEREIKEFLIGFRVYQENGSKSDARGKFEGFSDKFDKWISAYSPRLTHFYTRSQNKNFTSEDLEIQDEFDTAVEPKEGQEKVYSIPRLRKCQSRSLIELLNLFGNLNGFELVLKYFDEEKLHFDIMSALMKIVGQNWMTYHKEFIHENALKFTSKAEQRIKNSTDAQLRDVKRERIEAIFNSIDNLKKRVLEKDQREKEAELFKLEISLMCLRSGFLNRRIQGIKELSNLARSIKMYSQKNFTGADLVAWIKENQVLDLILDPRKTHIQLVQRIADILRLLAYEDELTGEELEKVWQLANSSYKNEVYKALNEISVNLKSEHADFFFTKITERNPNEFRVEDFSCLSDLGKYSIDQDFKKKLVEFFLQIIKNSEEFKEEVQENAVAKFCEMIKPWDVEQKKVFFGELIGSINDKKGHSLTSLIALRQLLEETIDRISNTYSSYSGYGYNQQSESAESKLSRKEELQNWLNSSIKDLNVVQIILDDFSAYWQRASQIQEKKQATKGPELQIGHHHHAEHSKKRLFFLRFLAQSSTEFSISQVELEHLYEVMVKGKIFDSDSDNFLLWCKTTCDQSSQANQLLNLEDVGLFFTKKIENGDLEIAKLSLTGFDLLQSYFLSSNEQEKKLNRIEQKESTSKGYQMYNLSNDTYSYSYSGNKKKKEETEIEFEVCVDPAELAHSQIAWNLALQTMKPQVVPKAVDFLIRLYSCFSQDQEQYRLKYMDSLIKQCLQITRDESNTGPQVSRALALIKQIIYQSERKGTGDIVPHNALLKGEVIKRISVRDRDQHRDIYLNLHSNTTMWEMKKRVGEQMGLVPKYLRLEKGQGYNAVAVKDTDNGKTLLDMGIKSRDFFTARRLELEEVGEEIPYAPILNEEQQFTEKAGKIFNDWFDAYSNENDQMTKDSCGLFIRGVTSEPPKMYDERVDILFKAHDKNKDGLIEREDFLEFYRSASCGKDTTVRENLRHNNIRNDLIKLIDAPLDSDYTIEEMPRHRLSADQEIFSTLMSLIHREGVSEEAWSLIQMLATNEEIYKSVMNVNEADWSKFFDTSNVYELMYRLQIVEAVIEEGNKEDQTLVVMADPLKYPKKGYPKITKLADSLSIIDKDTVYKKQWVTKFLEKGGFKFMLETFMNYQVDSDSFKLHYASFMLKLLKFFVVLLISSQQTEVTTLLRRKSSVNEEEQTAASNSQQDELNEAAIKNLGGDQLQAMITGDMGMQILEEIDHKNLQTKLIKVIQLCIHKKDEMKFEDIQIIKNSFALWICLVADEKDLFQVFLKDQEIDSEAFLLEGLLECQEEEIRECFRQSLIALTKTKEAAEMRLWILSMLSSKFEQSSSFESKQYFDLLIELIDEQFKDSDSSAQFDPKDLLTQIINKIQKINSGEDPESTEQLYTGIIRLMTKIIENFDISLCEEIVLEKGLIKEIFVNLIFASVFVEGEAQGVKSPSYALKSSSFRLIMMLVKRSPKLMLLFLQDCFVKLTEKIKRKNEWNYVPPSQSQRAQSFVGLRNLGCICYMNSILQQFFNVPSFRYQLLSVDDNVAEDLQEYKGKKIDDNPLHQLQKVFAHLEVSERIDYNPFEFCFSFKDFEGQPTNTAEQKDAQEFLTMLFDKVESGLRGTPMKYLTQSIFYGQTCAQIICQECGQVKNRLEDYSNLSLTIKDKRSIHESLQEMIKAETISDFECEKCQKKVDITKRTLIAHTPSVLFVHLQRLVFNFDTFQNDKVNTLCEFPDTLDLKPYSFYSIMEKEGRLKKEKKQDEEDDEEEEEEAKQKREEEEKSWPQEEDCYEYKLVGATIHSGTANAGHYWSYINTKRGTSEDEKHADWEHTDVDPWMEFNDSHVSDLDYKKIQEDGFGGEKTTGGWSAFSSSYGKSAYMLVYERKEKKKVKVLVEKEAEGAEFDKEKEEHFKMVDFKEAAKPTGHCPIYNSVKEDNAKFEFENDIYSEEFFNFTTEILQAINQMETQTEEQRKKLNMLGETIGRKVALDIVSRCHDNKAMEDMVEAMKRIFDQSDAACLAFIGTALKEDNGESLLDLLLECPDGLSRNQTGDLIEHALDRLKVIEKDLILADGENKSYAVKFVERLLNAFKYKAAKNQYRLPRFLQLIAQWAKETEESGDIGLRWMFKNHFISKAADFILGKKSPLWDDTKELRHEISLGGYNPPNFGPLIALMSKMIQSPLKQEYPLLPIEEEMIMTKDLLKIMLGSGSSSEEFSTSLTKMCEENEDLSQKICLVFVQQLGNTNQVDQMKNYLHALKPFLLLNDSLKQKRIEWLLGIPQITGRKGYNEEKYRFGVEIINLVNDDVRTYPSPLNNKINEEVLLSICRKQAESLAVTGLTFLSEIMAEDEDVLRYVHSMPAPSYQFHRYTDWIHPFLVKQRATIEKDNVPQYYLTRYNNVIGALKNWEEIMPKIKELNEKVNKETEQPEIEGWPMRTSVITNKPIAYIIGKHVEDNEIENVEIIGAEGSEVQVDVKVTEETTEYLESNPTGEFNLSITQKQRKVGSYQTISYQQYMINRETSYNQALKRKQEKEEKKKQESEEKKEEEKEEGEVGEESDEVEEVVEEFVKEEPVDFMFWNANKKEGKTLVRINIKCNIEMEFGDKMKASVRIVEANGLRKPLSFVTKDNIDTSNWTLVGHFELEKPETNLESVKLEVKTELLQAPKYKPTTTSSSTGTQGGSYFDQDEDIYTQLYS